MLGGVSKNGQASEEYRWFATKVALFKNIHIIKIKENIFSHLKFLSILRLGNAFA